METMIFCYQSFPVISGQSGHGTEKVLPMKFKIMVSIMSAVCGEWTMYVFHTSVATKALSPRVFVKKYKICFWHCANRKGMLVSV